MLIKVLWCYFFHLKENLPNLGNGISYCPVCECFYEGFFEWEGEAKLEKQKRKANILL